MVCIIGPSGSGKSTILKLINGLIKADVGEVTVLGSTLDYNDGAVMRRKIGFVLQKPALFPHYTVAQNISVVPNLLGWSQEKIDVRVRELLEMMRLDPNDYSSRYPSQLSGGQSQRVGIARALAANPELCLYDEPFSALDPITRSELQDEVIRLKTELGKTSVFVTHDIREAFKLGDEIMIINGGKIEQQGSKEEILSNPKTDFVKRFIEQHD
ncbi:MAG: ABC transporter ATP-binding protein [Flavobacteriales bacterium]|nr:ABC transporter ATP-binding protein [Flavobacteriales bacterium]